MNAWIGLGSNQDEPEQQLCAAVGHLQNMDEIDVVRTSGFYQTAPWGGVEQAPFVNAVAEIETELQPLPLLKVLLSIERQMGRERTGDRWGPRCIDLDLLTYNDLELTSPELELPHPRMHLRAFVLRPLLELDEDFLIPGMGAASARLEVVEEQDVQWLGTAERFCHRKTPK
jgi:2-amino-4-hydroxy-6-hydroxymethyldihydropteridine diphosphokinase